MGLRTALTDTFGIDHPVVLAPMGGVAGGALAAAVSDGGGLGVIGAGAGDLRLARTRVRPGAGRHAKTLGYRLSGLGHRRGRHRRRDSAVPRDDHAVVRRPRPVRRHDPGGGHPLIVQVTNLAEARRALDVGADVVVAQGSEAGGHGGGRATLPFVPAVVDIAGPVPVLAAGGIGDGRGLAAALVLGAAGAVIGTRFEATHEALITAEEAKAMSPQAPRTRSRGERSTWSATRSGLPGTRRGRCATR